MTPVQKQQEITVKNVVVSGWPLNEKIPFDEVGLRKIAGTPSRQISINGRYCHLYRMKLLKLIIQTTPLSLLLETVIQQL